MNYEEFNKLTPRFDDRVAAGRELANALKDYRQKPNTIVAGIPRGGVVTAAAVADALDLPLDVIVVRKLATPGQAELAMGAIGSDGVRILNWDVLSVLRITPEDVDDETRRQELELERRRHLFGTPLPLAHQTVIIVDDGIATGATMEAAVAVAHRSHAARVIVAAPVATVETCRRLQLQADELVCLDTPEPFFAVSYWYRDFPQVDDRDVKAILEHARSRVAA